MVEYDFHQEFKVNKVENKKQTKNNKKSQLSMTWIAPTFKTRFLDQQQQQNYNNENNNYNKSLIIDSSTAIYHLFWPKSKVRGLWSTAFLGCDSIELNLVLYS